MTPFSPLFTDIQKKYSSANIGSQYQITSRYCPQGEMGGLDELGDLEELDFSSQEVVGVIQVWSGSRLGAHFWSIHEEKELLNILLKPDQPKDVLLQKLDSILGYRQA